MKAVLLIDFGSTYTKVTAVDVDSEEILGTAQSFTTIETDIMDGLSNAVAILREKIGGVEFAEQYACSSAAGGLRMVAIGLVPELTAKAARQASLGAGAKVLKTYSYELTAGDLKEIDEINPDICLLTGGTDGGNKENILTNAATLAKSTRDFPIIIAGNRVCADQCAEILRDKQIHICENVMPKLDTPNVGPVQEKIRSIFLEQIVKAKGLSNAEALVEGILMPTPAAMLEAMKLLAKGTRHEAGIGDLLGVDLGGATTDIYSMSQGLPTKGMTTLRGLREEYAKRTVEGDIGMRYSIHGIVDAAGIDRIAKISGIEAEKAQAMVDHLSEHTDEVPTNEEWERLDFALAAMACETAARRHSGSTEEAYTMAGKVFVQTGKDLRPVRQIIVTGGSLIHTKRTGEIASHALFDPAEPMSLRPMKAQVLVDRSYILAAMGLLAEYEPLVALHIMKKELIPDGYQE